MSEHARELEVELYVRALAPDGAETVPAAVYQRLRGLEAEGAIDACEVTVWGKKVPLDHPASADGYGRDVLDTVEAFENWAARAGVSLQPGFVRRTHVATPVSEERTELVLPVACVAVYRGGDLVCVAPFADGDDACTVEDCVSTLSDDRAIVDRPADLLSP
jgi:hypothetical protein